MTEEVFELVDAHHHLWDLTAVDYLTHPGRTLPEGIVGERFELVVNLLSIERRERIRLRVQVPESDASIASAFTWPCLVAATPIEV